MLIDRDDPKMRSARSAVCVALFNAATEGRGLTRRDIKLTTGLDYETVDLILEHLEQDYEALAFSSKMRGPGRPATYIHLTDGLVGSGQPGRVAYRPSGELDGVMPRCGPLCSHSERDVTVR